MLLAPLPPSLSVSHLFFFLNRGYFPMPCWFSYFYIVLFAILLCRTVLMLKTFSKRCTVWAILFWSNEECHILWKGGYDHLIWHCWFMWKMSSKDVCQEVTWNTLHHTTFMCTVQQLWRNVTLDAIRSTGNLKYEDEVLHLVPDVPSDWLYDGNESQGCLAHVIWTGTSCHPQRICDEARRFSSWVQFSQWYLHQYNTQSSHILFCSHMMCASCMKQYLTDETTTYVMKTIHMPPFTNDTSSSLH